MVASLLGVTACGGSDSIALGDLGDEVVRAQCARTVRCGAYVSMDECLASGRVNLDLIAHAVDAGRVAYDGEAARACLDALEGASCDTTTEGARVEPAACAQALAGTVADGGTCFDDLECISDSCDVPDCGMACCQGTCDPTVAEAALGQSCANARCADDAFCNPQRVCAALLAAGTPCDGDDECAYGLACSGEVCVPAANRGEACADGDCHDLGDFCDGQSCVARRGVGGSCRMGFAGVFDCQLPLVCNQQSFTCEEPPTAGQACDFFCAGGLFCNDQNVCEAPRADGAACTSDFDCASLYCDETGAAGMCAPVPACS